MVFLLLVFLFTLFGFEEASLSQNGLAIEVGSVREGLSSVETPHIDYVSMSFDQYHEDLIQTIWYDDFSTNKQYMDSRGALDTIVNFGAMGGSVNVGFKKGDVFGLGDRKVAFGDFPGNGPVLKQGQSFNEIYWRIYVKHEYGWNGSPAKMSRATSIVSDSWKQAMIAHVWHGGGHLLTLDPARGVHEQTDSIITTKYNDFDNLLWLGNSPTSKFPLSSTEESGYWVLVESRVKLNTPGKNDGINQLWIDGRLEVERENLNLRGNYTKHGINAVFLESYWNKGSLKDQGRWYDNFVIATVPIGPVVCPQNPTLVKTPYHGPGSLKNWELELASDFNGTEKVFVSNSLGANNKIIVTNENGNFLGPLKGKSELTSGITYFARVRQQSTNGQWSAWSRWHQGFKVE
tara:strand:- start:10198 stop:11409 length:1212 start_codon:yes stop_codon:yes gene_type:complete